MLHMLEIVRRRDLKDWLWFFCTTFKYRTEGIGDPSEHRGLLCFFRIELNFTHREIKAQATALELD